MKTPESQFEALKPKRLTGDPHFIAGLVLIIIASLCIGGFLMVLDVRGPTYSDHASYHLPSIMKIRSHWPSLDIKEDTLSAIAPGYYYILAGLSFLTSGSEISLRLANLVASSLLPALLYCYLAYNRVNARHSVVFVLPILLSPVFLKNSIWIMTDNAALLLVALSLILILEEHIVSVSSIGIGIIVSMATFVRQLNIWLVVPSFINSLIPSSPPAEQDRDSSLTSGRLYARKLMVPSFRVIFLFLPLLVLLILYVSWGGLVPSKWSEASLSLSFCPAAYILSVFGVYGYAYISSIAAKPLGHYLGLASIRYFLAAGLIMSLITPTSYSYESGRWGGFFWEIVKRIPTYEERSIFFMILAPIGSGMIGIMFHEMRKRFMTRESILWIFSVFAWTSTFILNRQVFHRYFEVQVLIFLAIGVCILGKAGSRRPVVDKLWPIFLLGLGQAGMLFLSLS